jgi:hypothetical protein
MTTPEQARIASLERSIAANRQKLAGLTAVHDHNGTVKNFRDPGEEAEFQRIEKQFDHARQAHRLEPIRPLAESSAEFLMRNINSLAPHTVDPKTRAPLDPSILRGGSAWLALHAAKVVGSAMEAAHRAPDLRPIVERDSTGREITEWIGSKSSWMNSFKAPVLAGVIMIDGTPGTF